MQGELNTDTALNQCGENDFYRRVTCDNPQPPDGAKVWENLPLPAFPVKAIGEGGTQAAR